MLKREANESPRFRAKHDTVDLLTVPFVALLPGSPLEPTVAWFYGIAVSIYYNDHNPPHFHVQYGQSRAKVGIADGKVTVGSLPPTAQRLVREWALAHRREWEDNWTRARADLPLERIPCPDDD